MVRLVAPEWDMCVATWIGSTGCANDKGRFVCPILRESKCTNALDFNGRGSSEVEGPFKSQAVIL